MGLQFKDKLKGALVVPIGLAVVLAPYSLMLGWNLITLAVFWFGIVPGLAISLPRLFNLALVSFVTTTIKPAPTTLD